jgi:hypothetical protein
MTSKRPPRGQRERERIRSERAAANKTANSIKWVELVTLPDPEKSHGKGRLIDSVSLPGKGVPKRGSPVFSTGGRRHLVMAPAIRSRRIDPDDLDAAVLSVA